MKPNIKRVLPARKTVFLSLAAIGVALSISISACQKANAPVNSVNDTVSTDDAADAITNAVSPDAAGLVTQEQTAIIIVNDDNLQCGVASDTSLVGQSTTGAATTFNYNLSSSRLLTCNDMIASEFQFNYSGVTGYTGSRMSSNDSVAAQFTVTGLQPSANQYLFNLTYTTDGSAVSEVENKNTFTCKISITCSNLTVDKSTGEIVSGSASVLISGASTSGKSFSYSGTITFLGNKEAALELGSGATYSIIWS